MQKGSSKASVAIMDVQCSAEVLMSPSARLNTVSSRAYCLDPEALQGCQALYCLVQPAEHLAKSHIMGSSKISPFRIIYIYTHVYSSSRLAPSRLVSSLHSTTFLSSLFLASHTSLPY